MIKNPRNDPRNEPSDNPFLSDSQIEKVPALPVPAVSSAPVCYALITEPIKHIYSIYGLVMTLVQIVTPWTEASAVEHNTRLGYVGTFPCGIIPSSAPSNVVRNLQLYLEKNWDREEGQCSIEGTECAVVKGFSSYPNVQADHDPELQRKHTLNFEGSSLRNALHHIKCFSLLASWAKDEAESSLATLSLGRDEFPLKLLKAHVLLNSIETFSSTCFGIHRDCEDVGAKAVLCTVVVKLTADEHDEPPSKMQVLFVFTYVLHIPCI